MTEPGLVRSGDHRSQQAAATQQRTRDSTDPSEHAPPGGRRGGEPGQSVSAMIASDRSRYDEHDHDHQPHNHGWSGRESDPAHRCGEHACNESNQNCATELQSGVQYRQTDADGDEKRQGMNGQLKQHAAEHAEAGQPRTRVMASMVGAASKWGNACASTTAAQFGLSCKSGQSCGSSQAPALIRTLPAPELFGQREP